MSLSDITEKFSLYSLLPSNIHESKGNTISLNHLTLLVNDKLCWLPFDFNKLVEEDELTRDELIELIWNHLINCDKINTSSFTKIPLPMIKIEGGIVTLFFRNLVFIKNKLEYTPADAFSDDVKVTLRAEKIIPLTDIQGV